MCLLAAPASASSLIYSDTTAPGSSAFTNAGATLGNYPFDLTSSSFTVKASGLYLFGLGVYDYNKGAVSVGVKVGLYNDTTNTGVVTLNIGGTAYDGTGGSMFTTESVGTPIALISGDTYSIKSWGWPSTPNTIGENLGTLTTFNTLGGDLTNVPGGTGGTATYGETASNVNTVAGLTNALCEIKSGCTASSGNNRYNGGTDYLADQTALIGTTPIPGALCLFGSGLVGLVMFGGRSKRKATAVAA